MESTQESVHEIKNFRSFLERYLDNNTKVLNYTTSFLTAVGDNYGSTMLAVTAKIQEGTKSVCTL